eukprot:TRINITY_DN156_c0_g1_i1.p3 TRINITY_DN156_c0_g1~~TRINITY_DN156_c0_g1_i1.p3  ORF type:complete len:51 (-),score=0.46 TRINITY_DN156_c0_g1_i1:216-368(-)
MVNTSLSERSLFCLFASCCAWNSSFVLVFVLLVLVDFFVFGPFFFVALIF